MPAATYTDAGCRAAGAGVPVPKTSQRLQKHETPQRKQTKSPRPEPDLSPEEPFTFVTFLGEFTFLGPRPEPDPLPEELSESATRVSDSVCLRCQRRAGTHTIKALAEVCEVETSALEYLRNEMTKSASSLSLKLQVSAERCAQASAATYSDAGCCAAAVPEKPATPENRNAPNGNKPQVHGLSPTISWRSQRS